MIKVAIPISGNLLSKNFNDCSYYAIYKIDKETIVSRKEGVAAEKTSKELPKWAEHSGITDVIVHEIDKVSMEYFSGTKINLFVGVNINTPEQLIEEYLKGTLRSDTHNIT